MISSAVSAPRLARLLVCGCVFAFAACAGGAAVEGPPAPTEPIPYSLLYVCIQNDAEIAVIDMIDLEVLDVISLTELGYGPGAMPHDVAVELDGSHWYVSLIGDNRVLRFDARNEVVGEIAMATPGLAEVEPLGGTLLVTRSMSAVDPPARIGLASGTPWEIEELDVFLPRPHGIVVDSEGRYAYTASLAQNRVAAIELATARVELTDVPGPVHALVQLAISPDGRTMVASGELSGQLLVFSLEDPARPRMLTAVSVGIQPFDPMFAPDGRTVWVPVKGSNQVVVVSTGEWRVVSRISTSDLLQPHALTFSPDGRRVFVTNNNTAAHMAHEPTAVASIPQDNVPRDSTPVAPVMPDPIASLVVIEAATGIVEAVLPLGHNLTGMGNRPPR